MRKAHRHPEQNALPGFTHRTLGRFVTRSSSPSPRRRRSFPRARRTSSAIRSVAPSWTTTCTRSRPATGSASSSPAGRRVRTSSTSGWPKPWRSSLPRSAPGSRSCTRRRQGPAGNRCTLREARVDRPASAAVAFIDDMPRAYAGAESPGVPRRRHHHRRADGLQEAGDPGAVSIRRRRPPDGERAQHGRGGRGAPAPGEGPDRPEAGRRDQDPWKGIGTGSGGCPGRAACWGDGGGAGDRDVCVSTLPGTAGQGGGTCRRRGSEIHPSSAIDYRRSRSSTFAVRDLERGTVFRNKKVKAISSGSGESA